MHINFGKLAPFLTHENSELREAIKNPEIFSKNSHNQIPKKIKERIVAILTDINGTRKERILTAGQIFQALKNLIGPDNCSQIFLHGGYVPYPIGKAKYAQTTVARFLKEDSWIFVTICRGIARKDFCTPFGRTDKKHDFLKALKDFRKNLGFLIYVT